MYNQGYWYEIYQGYWYEVSIDRNYLCDLQIEGLQTVMSSSLRTEGTFKPQICTEILYTLRSLSHIVNIFS